MALFEQVGNYVKVRTTTLPETSNQEDFERIHISEFSAPTKGASTVAFMDGDRTILVINGDTEAQSFYGDDMAQLISDLDDFIVILQETGGSGGGPDTTSIARNGSRAPSADTPWNSKKITGLANGASSGDAVNKGQLDAVAASIPDVSGYLPVSGAVQGGQSQGQEFRNFVKAVNNTDSTEAKLNDDGSITQISKENGAFLNVVTKSIKVHVASGAIKNMNATPIELVPAQGAGKIVRLLDAVLNYNAGDEAFEEIGEILLITESISNPNTQNQKKFTNGIVTNTESTIRYAFDMGDSIDTAASTLIENKALQAISPNGSGQGDGSIDFYITYQIITL